MPFDSQQPCAMDFHKAFHEDIDSLDETQHRVFVSIQSNVELLDDPESDNHGNI